MTSVCLINLLFNHYSAYFLPREALVQRADGAALRLHVVRPCVCCLSVCDVGGSGPHRLEIFETNWTDN